METVNDGQLYRPENYKILSLKYWKKKINLEFYVQQKYPKTWKKKKKEAKSISNRQKVRASLQ